jgi:hypothetical protein
VSRLDRGLRFPELRPGTLDRVPLSLSLVLVPLSQTFDRRPLRVDPALDLPAFRCMLLALGDLLEPANQLSHGPIALGQTGEGIRRVGAARL